MGFAGNQSGVLTERCARVLLATAVVAVGIADGSAILVNIAIIVMFLRCCCFCCCRAALIADCQSAIKAA